MDTVYADTNVYMDWIENRRGRGFMWNQADEARDFFNGVLAGDYCLLTSDHLEDQLRSKLKDYTPYIDYIHDLDIKGLHKNVSTNQNDKDLAYADSVKHKTQFEDALHCHLALKGGAQWFITQNLPDFAGFRDKIKVRRPRWIGLDFQ